MLEFLTRTMCGSGVETGWVGRWWSYRWEGHYRVLSTNTCSSQAKRCRVKYSIQSNDVFEGVRVENLTSQLFVFFVCVLNSESLQREDAGWESSYCRCSFCSFNQHGNPEQLLQVPKESLKIRRAELCWAFISFLHKMQCFSVDWLRRLEQFKKKKQTKSIGKHLVGHNEEWKHEKQDANRNMKSSGQSASSGKSSPVEPSRREPLTCRW